MYPLLYQNKIHIRKKRIILTVMDITAAWENKLRRRKLSSNWTVITKKKIRGIIDTCIAWSFNMIISVIVFISIIQTNMMTTVQVALTKTSGSYDGKFCTLLMFTIKKFITLCMCIAISLTQSYPKKVSLAQHNLPWHILLSFWSTPIAQLGKGHIALNWHPVWNV